MNWLMMNIIKKLCWSIPLVAASSIWALPYVVYQGTAGAGFGKHIVFIAGDEEYHSEESLPMLAKILAVHHGFKCTVLFSQDSVTGAINPDNQTYIAGMSNLEKADLVVVLTRFREYSNVNMKYFVDYLNSGKPIIGIRTATHAFNYTRDLSSPYAKYDFRSSTFSGGFGKQVLGETWVNHWGVHGSQATRGVIRAARKSHPILNGVGDIFGPTDVYEVSSLSGDADVLVDGQVITGLKATDPPLSGKATMPIAWTKSYTGENQKQTRVFTSTIGASQDFLNEGLRRMIVNACYWGLQMESVIPDKANVDFVGTYIPLPFTTKFKVGVKPDDLAMTPVGLDEATRHKLNPSQIPTWAKLFLKEFRLNGRWLGAVE
jgi:type 1 glutamine amidotransferase